MKKTILLFAFAMSFCAANAQITLSGTSYTENFDGLGTMPDGWNTYNSATITSLGTLEGLGSPLPGYPSVLRPDTTCIALVLTGGFKNFPSATVCSAGDDWCAVVPPSYSNRALGVRQVSYSNGTHPHLDSGAAFALQLANTSGFSHFNLSFKLQSLDTSSPRVTTWKVDYGFGASPTSFMIAPAVGTMTTGGNTFSNNTVNVDFGSALDNQAGPVWIRIVAHDPSTGSGNRPSSAIDDFSLTYNNTTGVNNLNTNGTIGLNVLGNATTSAINFNCNTEEAGQYAITLCDMTGRSVYSENVQLATGGQAHTINTNLAPGIYIARMSNGKSLATAKVSVR